MARFVLLTALLSGLLSLCPLQPVTAAETDQQGTDAPKLKEVIAPTAVDPDPEEGQSSAAETAVRKLVKYGPDDPYERGVPRTSVAGYIRAAQGKDFDQAVEYLDLRNLPLGLEVEDGPQLARKLAVILTRALWIEMDALSMSPEGHSEDGLPPFRDLVGQVQAGSEKYDVLLQRVPRGDGVSIWKFSSRTVASIPAMYERVGYGPIAEKLADRFPSAPLLGFEIWQWLYLLLIIAAAAAISIPIMRLGSWLVRRRKLPLTEVLVRFLNGPLLLVLILLIVRANVDLIRPSLEARSLFEARSLMTLVTAWAVIRFADLLRDYWSFKLRRAGRAHATALVQHAVTTFNIMVVIVAALVWLDNIGFDVTAIMAGLGIGGIAIALATQKTIEQFIGGVTLYLSEPVRVGDFCRFGDKMGTVEEIGLRSTKVRTLEETLVSIPNGEFVGMQLENFGARRRIRFAPRIRLRANTSADQIRLIVRELQKLLHAHSRVADAPVRVRFAGFGEDSLDIDLHSYVETSVFDSYLAVAEDLNLRIMGIIHSAGTEIALPTHIEYQLDGLGLNADKQEAARQMLEASKVEGNIGADLSVEEIAEIRNSIPSPPGSS